MMMATIPMISCKEEASNKFIYLCLNFNFLIFNVKLNFENLKLWNSLKFQL